MSYLCKVQIEIELKTAQHPTYFYSFSSRMRKIKVVLFFLICDVSTSSLMVNETSCVSNCSKKKIVIHEHRP